MIEDGHRTNPRFEWNTLVARRDSADSGSGVAELSYLEIKLTRLVLSIAV